MSTTTAPPTRPGAGDARRPLGRPGVLRRTTLLTALALAVSGLAGPLGGAAASAAPAPATAAASGPSGITASPVSTGRIADGRPVRSAGCGTDAGQAPGSSVLHTLTSDGRERTVQLHLPDAYRSDRAWPVVLVYHGRGNSGARTEAFSGLDALPAIVAYGNGVIGTGDGDRQAWEGAPYSAPGVDDVAYTNDLLDKLESELCVDTRRVYATGKSNGAGFTAILACELSDRITAIAPVAAALYGTGHPDCLPRRPVPVIEFHGTNDVTIPYVGDVDRGLPAVPHWVGGWVERNECATGPAVEATAVDVTTYRWTDCRSGADVTHVAVLGGGHTWPGEDSYSGGGYATHSIEAHEVMWDFLQDERIPARFLTGGRERGAAS